MCTAASYRHTKGDYSFRSWGVTSFKAREWAWGDQGRGKAPGLLIVRSTYTLQPQSFAVSCSHLFSIILIIITPTSHLKKKKSNVLGRQCFGRTCLEDLWTRKPGFKCPLLLTSPKSSAQSFNIWLFPLPYNRHTSPEPCLMGLPWGWNYKVWLGKALLNWLSAVQLWDPLLPPPPRILTRGRKWPIIIMT